MKKWAAIFVVSTVCYPTVALAGLFGPSTYDECLLENLKGVGSDLAARAVAGVCSRKFPPKPVAAKVISPSATVPASSRGKSVDPSGRFTDIEYDPVK